MRIKPIENIHMSDEEFHRLKNTLFKSLPFINFITARSKASMYLNFHRHYKQPSNSLDAVLPFSYFILQCYQSTVILCTISNIAFTALRSEPQNEKVIQITADSSWSIRCFACKRLLLGNTFLESVLQWEFPIIYLTKLTWHLFLITPFTN